MLSDASYERLPEHMQEGMRLYIELGVEPGSFLRAVVEGRLVLSFMLADTTNRQRMFDFASFLFNDAPGNCHGSPGKVAAWIAHHGLDGLEPDNA